MARAFDLVGLRLRNSRLTGAPLPSVAEAVGWFGAVQAQDFAGDRWAIGQRVPGTTEATLDAAYDGGDLIRTHVLRPTWHFVAPADPAQLADFAWWSGLTISDARRAVDALGPALESRTIDDATYWLTAGTGSLGRRARAPLVHLLPNYDESIVAYRHRSFVAGLALLATLGTRPNLLFHNLVTLGGVPIGTWRRATKPGPPVVVHLAAALPAPAQRALDAAIARYAAFAAPARRS